MTSATGALEKGLFESVIDSFGVEEMCGLNEGEVRGAGTATIPRHHQKQQQPPRQTSARPGRHQYVAVKRQSFLDPFKADPFGAEADPFGVGRNKFVDPIARIANRCEPKPRSERSEEETLLLPPSPATSIYAAGNGPSPKCVKDIEVLEERPVITKVTVRKLEAAFDECLLQDEEDSELDDVVQTSGTFHGAVQQQGPVGEAGEQFIQSTRDKVRLEPDGVKLGVSALPQLEPDGLLSKQTNEGSSCNDAASPSIECDAGGDNVIVASAPTKVDERSTEPHRESRQSTQDEDTVTHSDDGSPAVVEKKERTGVATTGSISDCHVGDADVNVEPAQSAKDEGGMKSPEETTPATGSNAADKLLSQSSPGVACSCTMKTNEEAAPAEEEVVSVPVPAVYDASAMKTPEGNVTTVIEVDAVEETVVDGQEIEKDSQVDSGNAPEKVIGIAKEEMPLEEPVHASMGTRNEYDGEGVVDRKGLQVIVSIGDGVVEMIAGAIEEEEAHEIADSTFVADEAEEDNDTATYFAEEEIVIVENTEISRLDIEMIAADYEEEVDKMATTSFVADKSEEVNDTCTAFAEEEKIAPNSEVAEEFNDNCYLFCGRRDYGLFVSSVEAPVETHSCLGAESAADALMTTASNAGEEPQTSAAIGLMQAGACEEIAINDGATAVDNCESPNPSSTTPSAEDDIERFDVFDDAAITVDVMADEVANFEDDGDVQERVGCWCY